MPRDKGPTSEEKEEATEEREEGREEGLRESILDIVQIRFNRLPLTLRSRIEAIEDLEALRLLRKRALEAQTISQIEEQLPG